MRKWSSVVVLAAILGGCSALQAKTSAAGPSSEPSEEELRERYPVAVVARITDIRDKHDLALATPTLASATAFGDALLAAFRDSFYEIDAIDWNAYATDAARLLGTLAPEGTPEEAANALAKRAMFQDVLGDEAGALASRRESFEHAHTYFSGLGMVWVLRTDGDAAGARALCEKTRPLARNEDEVYDLYRECLQASTEGETLEQRLPWASAEDLAAYRERERSEADARLSRRQADEAASRELRHESSEPGTAPSEAPAAPKRASFTLHNARPKTVKLFYGKTPKYGSGRTSSLSANTRQSETMNDGEMIWILDESGNGVSSFSASASVREVEITSNCVSFQAR